MSCKDSTYNGWTNRATWLVNVWGNPESRADVQILHEDLESQYDELPNGILKDMLDMSEINWDELESHFDEDEDSDEDSDEDGIDYSPEGTAEEQAIESLRLKR